MTRDEAKKMLPIVKAFAEGKVIETFDDVHGWVETEEPMFNLSPEFYRIKIEHKYRPFRNQEECLNEIQKHQPVGWLKSKKDNCLHLIGKVETDDEDDDVLITLYDGTRISDIQNFIDKEYTFADDTPLAMTDD